MNVAPHPDNCKDIFALLSDYLDLELPADACEQIRDHLEGCPPCVDFVESLRKSVELCRSYDTGVLPGPLSQETRRQLEDAWRKLLASRAASSPAE